MTRPTWSPSIYGRALVGDADGTDDEAKRRLLTVPVEPGWHDPAPLLGYSNPLAGGAYQRTKFLDFLIRAAERPFEPHVCILDEMNLSHPEQYLAPLLSAMEQRNGVLDLHSGGVGDSDDGLAREEVCAPPSLKYPPNLVLIGTVNMDETTMGISDKVLDRAFTLEFWDIDVEVWPGWENCKLNLRDRDRLKRLLSDLMTALEPARLHFGWRVIAEIVRFLEARGRDGGGLSFDDAMDRVIYAKVLPKLRGDDSSRFGDALKECEKVLEAENLGSRGLPGTQARSCGDGRSERGFPGTPGGYVPRAAGARLPPVDRRRGDTARRCREHRWRARRGRGRRRTDVELDARLLRWDGTRGADRRHGSFVGHLVA